MLNVLPTLAALAIGFAAPVLAPGTTPEAQLADAVRGRVAGRPVSCIPLHDVSSTQIIDHTAIVYRLGGKVFVNRPRGGAKSLRSDDILITRNSGGLLCRPETVQLIDRASRGLHGVVSLGDFVPYTHALR